MNYIAKDRDKLIVIDKKSILLTCRNIKENSYYASKRKNDNKVTSDTYSKIYSKIIKWIIISKKRNKNAYNKQKHKERECKKSKQIMNIYQKAFESHFVFFHLIPFTQIANILPRFYKKINKIIKIPKGFESDFASVPFLFRVLVSPIGKHSKPAVLHDYLCELYHLGIVSRDYCDEVFNEAMKVKCVSTYHRIILYGGVRIYAYYLKFKSLFQKRS